jgi:hypothetical protein
LIKFLVHQNARARNKWTMAHNKKAGHEFCLIFL